MASNYTWKQRIALATVPIAASFVIRCLCATLRYRDVCEPGAKPGADPDSPRIYAFWHCCLLACAWHFRGLGIAILISQSFDGELIARTVERLGFTAVRGSSSRDGAAGLRNLYRTWLDGHYCGITADGPRGPAMVAKAGIVQLARLAGRDAGVFYAHPERAWRLGSWDGLLVPKPFSRVTVAWTRDAPAELAAVQAALERSVKLAQEVS